MQSNDIMDHKVLNLNVFTSERGKNLPGANDDAA